MDRVNLNGKLNNFPVNAKLTKFLVLMTVFLATSVIGAYAQHDATVTIDPDLANCEALGNTFTVNVANNVGSSNALLQVEIYKALAGISDFSCGVAPTGWTLFSYTDRCIYVTGLTSGYKIAPNTNLDFTFDAIMSSDACASEFIVVTVDDAYPQGDRDTTLVDVAIDCTPPVIIKEVGEPKISGDGFDWWVTQNTLFSFTATDNTDTCDLGVDYCKWRYAVDDGTPGPWHMEENGKVMEWEFTYGEDSNHYLEVECYDIAGNKRVLTEWDKVDTTYPLTYKTYGDPHYPFDINGDASYPHWITTGTPVTLTAEDGGEICAVGVDKTWYINLLVPDNYCAVEQDCLSTCSNPYDEECLNTWITIDWFQEQCALDLMGYSTWEECVESNVHRCCDRDVHDLCAPGIQTCDISCSIEGSCGEDNGIDDFWELYTIPFYKGEESCHLIQYFSIDNLGNIEPMNHQCVYVEDQPPMAVKEHGTPYIQDEGFGWVTQNTEITIDCDDTWGGQAPHPVDHEELCYKVSYDDFEPGYLTDQYCAWYGGTMDDEDYCCVDVSNEKYLSLYFMEDSYHNLEYYCVDALGNDERTLMDGFPHIQWYKVDTVSPTITKTMIGNYLGDCPPRGPDDICYVADNGDSGVHVEVTDGGPICAVDNMECSYEVWWQTSSEECECRPYEGGWCLVDTGEFSETTDILFTEDSTHELYIYCKDELGNLVDDWETFLVDSTPPETTKWYGDPFVEDQFPKGCYEGCEMMYEGDPEDMSTCLLDCGWAEWITTETPVYMSATDEKVGVDETYWRNMVITDPMAAWHICGHMPMQVEQGDYCHPEFYMQEVDNPDKLFTTYTGPFTKQEESCHIIEYYSVDRLGNEESLQWQCVYVDDTAPTVWKILGEPKILASEEPEVWYVNGQTDITMYCEDMEPHPVDHVTLWYRYRISDDCTSWGDWTTWMDYSEPSYLEGENPYLLMKTINFPEDSCHELEYYCVDGLGNTEEEHYFEIDIVDNKPPVIETWIEGPNIEMECEVGEMYTCEGWSCLGEGHKDFFVTGRSDTTNWDLAIWSGDPESVQNQEEYSWVNGGETVPFTVMYDPMTGSVTYEVDGVSLDWTYDTGKGFEYLVVMAKGNNGGDMYLTNLILNGEALPDVYSEGNYKGLVLPMGDVEQAYGFTLTGYAAMEWESKTTQEIPGFHVFAMNTHDLTDGLCRYIDGVTKIHMEAYDPDPHPVDQVECHWGYYLDDGEFYGWNEIFPIVFPEETKHELVVECWDGLGNKAEKVEFYYVDKTAPTTHKEYGEPFFSNELAEWATSWTPITLSVEDSGPHKTGIADTWYRVTLMDDEAYCWDIEMCEESVGEGEWMTYQGEPFFMPEESCHLIEYYSMDNVEKTEVVKKQCVFVDNTSPTPNKTVGEPKAVWDGLNAQWYTWIGDYCWNGGEDEIECWKVTKLTPISMDCEDPDPHPVDHERVCFQLELDAKYDMTDEYCGYYGGEMMDDDYCCIDSTIDNFLFYEDSEHNLKYYCVDALGNTGPVDEEKFKVEGTKFDIHMFDKWNLISVPFVLLDNDVNDVFSDIEEDVDAVWTYDDGEWFVWTPDGEDNDNLETIDPGFGYWVLANKGDWEEPVVLSVGGALLSPAQIPKVTRQLEAGWNLIGYYGTSWTWYQYFADEGYVSQCQNWHEGFSYLNYIYGDKAYCALSSMVNTMMGYPKWDSLWSYINCGDHQDAWIGINTCIVDPMDQMLMRMYAGRGYWLHLDEADEYVPSTTCIWNENFQCVWTGGGIVP